MGIWPDERNLSPEALTGIETVLKAYKSVLSPLAYISMPITSGRRLYDAMEKYGVCSPEDLSKKYPDVFVNEIIKPNIEAGLAFAKETAARTELPVVAPAVFEAKKQRWGQDEYMHMWLNMIEDKVEEIYMMEGWEYSNGGTEEFARGMEMRFNFCDRRNIRVFDHRFREMGIIDGATAMVRAIHDLRRRGFGDQTGVPAKMACKLTTIAAFFMDPLTSRREWLDGMYHTGNLQDFNWEIISGAYESVRRTETC